MPNNKPLFVFITPPHTINDLCLEQAIKGQEDYIVGGIAMLILPIYKSHYKCTVLFTCKETGNNQGLAYM